MSFSLKFCAQPLFFSPCASPSPQPFIRSLNDSTRQCAASFTEHLTFALVGQPSSDGPDGLLPKLQALKEQVTTIFACAPARTQAPSRKAGPIGSKHAKQGLARPHKKRVLTGHAHENKPEMQALGMGAHTRGRIYQMQESVRCCGVRRFVCIVYL